MVDFRIAHCRLTDEGLEIGFEGLVRRTTFPWHWLRDNADDDYTFNPATGQRRIDSFAIPPHLAGIVEINDQCDEIRISWSDNSQRSVYTSYRLAEAVAGTRMPEGPSAVNRQRPGGDRTRELWEGTPPMAACGFTPYVDVVGSDDVLLQWLDAIHRWGFACLEGVPPGKVALVTLANRIAYVRSTVFGGVWDLASDVTNHADTAYGSDSLMPHTDATYLNDAPGLQIFSCQQAADNGGESILVDGFAVADRIFGTDLESLEMLARVAVPGSYVEDGVDLRANRPVLRFDHRGRLEQVSFNNFDRGDVLMAPQHYKSFFRAYSTFNRLVMNQERWLGFAWEEGQVLAIDNWRLLHGRRRFSGNRHYVGCYINYDDYQSKRRVLRAERDRALGRS